MMYGRSALWYDRIYTFKDYAGEAEQLHTLIQLHCCSGGRRLLDVACGTGNHLVHLREHYEVEGLDLQEDMLEQARGKLESIPLHVGDMLTFNLERHFDVIVCLFSSIGYMLTVERLQSAVRNIARHLESGGLLVIEPWFSPQRYTAGIVSATFVDDPELKIARMSISERAGHVSVLEMHHMVATPQGVETFVDRHELGLFTDDHYRTAIAGAGLSVEYDAAGLTGRGLYLGVHPHDRESEIPRNH